MGFPKSSSDDVLLMRRTRALELRVEGKKTQREIAEILGVSVPTISNDIAWMMAHETVDNPKLVAQARQLQEQRLDLYLKETMMALESATTVKDKASILQVLLKLDERRAKLLGLDAPVKQEIETTTVGEATPAAVRAALAAHFPTSVKKPVEPDAN